MKLNNTEAEAWPLGLGFYIPKTSTNTIDGEAQFENLFDQLEDLHLMNDEEKGWFKSELLHVADQYFISSTSKSNIWSKKTSDSCKKH